MYYARASQCFAGEMKRLARSIRSCRLVSISSTDLRHRPRKIHVFLNQATVFYSSLAPSCQDYTKLNTHIAGLHRCRRCESDDEQTPDFDVRLLLQVHACYILRVRRVRRTVSLECSMPDQVCKQYGAALNTWRGFQASLLTIAQRLRVDWQVST